MSQLLDRADTHADRGDADRDTDRAGMALVRRARRATSQYLDRPYASLQLLVVSGGLLLAFGLLMAASTTISASLHNTNEAIWTQLIRHVEYLVVGLVVLWFGLRLPPRAYRKLAYPALAVALALLIAVLVPGIGVKVNVARRWIDLGPVQVQPSEFAKLALLLWGADLLARKKRLGSLIRARHIFIPLLPGFGLACALIMLEPDLGTTLCMLLILLGLLWTVGLPLRYFVGMVAGIGGAVTLLAVSAPYRMERLTTFADPFADAEGTGFHAVQGLYALASGGIFGVGLGRGTSKYGWVPNANTDYVFSVIGEELGLLGCVAVLGLFGVFAFAAVRVARNSSDQFVTLVTTTCAIWICGQALINVGYVTAMLPVTGIPLPFISAGGTSLILTCGVLGMLLSFARHEPAAVAASQAAFAAGRRPLIERLLRLPVPRAFVEPPVVRKRPSRARPPVTRGSAPRPAGARSGAPRSGASRATTAAPRTTPRTATPRTATPHTATARTSAPRTSAPRTAAPRPT
ncbi:MAG: Cell division-specific peptidoglycan biosynthesis regulator FtsW, partial [Pseudonocardiales bacterium]|nr:Cell division-specific peptidoglycan biosynthesis regulator FtsW [Pseudonocardiales bacterium]